MAAATFDTRLARLVHKHRRMEVAGVTYRVGRDGLISAHPRRRASVAFPLRSVALLLLGGLAFKALLLLALGEQVYASRVEDLAGGSLAERAGAFVMQADLATLTVARVLADLSG